MKVTLFRGGQKEVHLVSGVLRPDNNVLRFITLHTATHDVDLSIPGQKIIIET